MLVLLIPESIVLPLAILLAGLILLFLSVWLHQRIFSHGPQAVNAVLDGMTNGVLVLTAKNQVVYLNPAAERILGVSAKVVTGQPAAQVFIDLPFLLNALTPTNEDHHNTVQLERKEGLAYFDLCVTTLSISNHWKHNTGKMVVLEDVTHRVQAELATSESQEKLRQSEETYRQLVENITETFFILDCSGIVTYVSQEVDRYTAFGLPKIIGMHYRQVINMEDGNNLDTIFQRTLAGEKESFKFRVTNAMGSVRTMLARQHRLMQDGKVMGVQGMVYDITEQLQVEEALERRASQLAIVNDIGEKIAALTDLDKVLDSATHLIQVNFGYYHVALFLPEPSQKELVMRAASGAFSTVFPDNHRLKFGQGMVGWVADHRSLLLTSDVRREPRYTNFYPEKILTRSELTLPVMLSDELVGVLDIQSPVINAFDENDVRVMKTIADQIAIAIENARLYNQVLNQLKETERKENMLRIQRDLVMAISSATKVQEMLTVALKMLALELNVQRAVILLLDSASGCLQPAATLGYPVHAPYPALPLDGDVTAWVARTGQPTLIANVRDVPANLKLPRDAGAAVCVPLISGSATIGVINLESTQPDAYTPDDLRLLVILANNLVVLIERARLFQEVEQARAELEARAGALEAANERLRELDRLKSQFLANMSHELRTPLNSVIGFSEILIDNLAGPLNSDQEECIHNIHDSGKHLLALINDLLDFTKIEAGRLTIDPTSFAVADLFDELRTTLLPLAEKKAHRLTFKVEPNLPLLSADRLRLKQVFINLLSNGNKFTPQGGQIITTCCLEESGHLLFCFEDDGIGIRPEHQKLIFEEFRQVDGSMTREAHGTGLGLAISQRIVLLHHGQIWVESDLGQGARFYVRLPITYQADMI